MLAVIYLIWTESCAPASGPDLLRPDLCTEAVRLAHLLSTMMPDEPEVLPLTALQLLHDARRPARTGELIPLPLPNRSSWDGRAIRPGWRCSPGPYVSADPVRTRFRRLSPHSTLVAPTAEQTDWTAIAARYAELYRPLPAPVAALNHAPCPSAWPPARTRLWR